MNELGLEADAGGVVPDAFGETLSRGGPRAIADAAAEAVTLGANALAGRTVVPLA